uniref:Interleukin-17F-like n=1 Tax=Crocodylus porosus TaxID=8502 RepID=A0A7M4E0W2_CROPO
CSPSLRHGYFESLLFVLILVLSMKSSAHGTPVHHKGNRENASLNPGKNCLNSKNTEFPRRVKVDVRFSNPNPATEVASDVNNRSLSPWDYSIDEDHNRFPQRISVAQCRSLTCVSSTGQEDFSLNSVPIQQEILVLRREQGECSSSYRLEKKLVTVGCTCARPHVQYQS